MEGLKVTNAAERSEDICLLLEIDDENLLKHDIDEIEKEIIKRVNKYEKLKERVENIGKSLEATVEQHLILRNKNLELIAQNREYEKIMREFIEDYEENNMALDILAANYNQRFRDILGIKEKDIDTILDEVEAKKVME